MIIKVGGIGDEGALRALARLDIDMLTLSLPLLGGFSAVAALPVCGARGYGASFTDAMPQTIIASVMTYHLSYIQLHGDESRVYIDNLRRTLVPDLVPQITIVKVLPVNTPGAVQRCEEYEGSVDLFQFVVHPAPDAAAPIDWAALAAAYPCATPFLVGGSLPLPAVDALLALGDERFAGVNIYYKSFAASAGACYAAVEAFIAALRQREQPL